MIISQAEFIRNYSQKMESFAWLLGAGCSLSAGLPTAQDIISDLKKRFYCTEENQNYSDADMAIASIRAKIQSYFDALDCPEEWSWEEYSFYFNLLFGDDLKKQREYIYGILNSERSALSMAQRVLAALLGNNKIPCLFTTNFDDIVENAYAEVNGQSLPVFHLEGSYAANEAINSGKQFPVYAKLHGDFQYQCLKNLEADLKAADECLGKAFMNAGNRFGCIVTGYSGRDESVMTLFEAILNSHNPFPHGLYWMTLKGRNVPPVVEAMLRKAREKGVEAHIVEIDGFETLMKAIWNICDFRNAELDQKVIQRTADLPKIQMNPVSAQQPIIRYNALIFSSLPSKVYRIETSSVSNWKELKDQTRKIKKWTVSYISNSVFAWGAKKTLKHAFGKDAKVTVQERITDLSDLRKDAALRGALEEAVCKALCCNRPIQHKKIGHDNYLIPSKEDADQEALRPLRAVFNAKFLHGNLDGITAEVFDHQTEELKQIPVTWTHALHVSLKLLGEKCVLTINPDIRISPKADSEAAKEFKFKMMRGRKNDVLDKILSAWVGILWGRKMQSPILNSMALVQLAKNVNRASF